MKKHVPIVKVFSATKAVDRDALGERVTAWLRDQPQLFYPEIRTLLSSDSEFHCLVITVIAHIEIEVPNPKAVTS